MLTSRTTSSSHQHSPSSKYSSSWYSQDSKSGGRSYNPKLPESQSRHPVKISSTRDFTPFIPPDEISYPARRRPDHLMESILNSEELTTAQSWGRAKGTTTSSSSSSDGGGACLDKGAMKQPGPWSVYKCPQCRYQCPNLDNMRKHMRIHTGEKPFACTLCTYKSAQRCNLYTHIKSHHSTEVQRE